MAARISTIQLLRRILLGAILIGVTLVTVLHQKIQGIPSIDALCPFGGLETLSKAVAGGELLKRVEPGTIVIFAGTVILGLTLSRFFCGWLCAFGALQGVFGWIGKKAFGRRFEPPSRLDRAARWLKYVALAAILWLTWRAGSLVVRPYDPWAAYGHLSAGFSELWAEFAVGLVILVVSLVLSLFYERAFCKYLCPMGALNAILGRVPLFRIRRDKISCVSCGKCDRVCPMNVDVSKPDSVESPECMACLECVSACPTKPVSLSATLGGKSIRTSAVVALGLALFFGSILVGKSLGYFRLAPPSLASLAASGKISVADIKGSSTWEGVAASFGIELERLYREAGVDSRKVPANSMLKEAGKLSGIEGFEADTVRQAVARILGIPYEGEGASAQSGMGGVSAEPRAPEPKAAESKASGSNEAAIPAAAQDKAPAASPSASASAPAATSAIAPAKASAAAPELPAKALALVVPADFVLEGTMSISEVAAALKTDPVTVIGKLELPRDIPIDRPLRDMKDSYGYNMPTLKERIKR